jgi:hypothetical protein
MKAKWTREANERQIAGYFDSIFMVYICINVTLSRCEEMGGCSHVLTIRRKFIEVSGPRTKTAETKEKSRSDKRFSTTSFRRDQNLKSEHCYVIHAYVFTTFNT